MTNHTSLPDDCYTDAVIEAGTAFLDEIRAKLVADRQKPFELSPMGHPFGCMRGDNIRAVIV